MFKTITIRSRSSYWTNRDSQEELEVDTDDLAKEVETQCNQLEEEGWEIVFMVPITSGNFVDGNGYYYTESMLITAKK
jgi:hypothetical protein